MVSVASYGGGGEGDLGGGGRDTGIGVGAGTGICMDEDTETLLCIDRVMREEGVRSKVGAGVGDSSDCRVVESGRSVVLRRLADDMCGRSTA